MTFALFCLPLVVAEPVPLRGSRAAMEFELAAREMRRADEEIKAAAWDEENSGRTPAVDAAVAELAREAKSVALVTSQVAAQISTQPEKKGRPLAEKAPNSSPTQAFHISADRERYEATNAAVMRQRQESRNHRAIESSTDEVVQAITQHSREQKMKKSTSATTDAAVKAIQQHSRERLHREAMNNAADSVVDAIKRHTTELHHRDDMNLATDILVHGVAQNSHERMVVDATKTAADLVRQHLEQQQEELPDDSDDDESTFQDLAEDA